MPERFLNPNKKTEVKKEEDEKKSAGVTPTKEDVRSPQVAAPVIAVGN